MMTFCRIIIAVASAILSTCFSAYVGSSGELKTVIAETHDRNGQPVRLDVITKNGNWHTDYSILEKVQMTGRAQVTALMKVGNNKDMNPVAYITMKSDSGWIRQVIDASMFPGTDSFYPIVLKDQPLSPNNGSIQLTANALCKDNPVWIDRFEIRKISPYREREIMEKRYPKLEVKFPGHLTVRRVMGLYWPLYRLDEVLKKLGADALDQYVMHYWGRQRVMDETAAMRAYRTGRSAGNESSVSETATSEGGKFYNAAIIVNVAAQGFSQKDRYYLAEFVKVGGHLLVLAGDCNLKNDYEKESIFEELYPVDFAKIPESWTKAAGEEGSKLVPNRESKITTGLPWSDSPRVFYFYRCTPVPGSTVHVMCSDGTPILISKTYGKGEVFLWLGTVLGGPEGNSGKKCVPFWEWKGWTELAARTLEAVGKKQ